MNVLTAHYANLNVLRMLFSRKMSCQKVKKSLLNSILNFHKNGRTSPRLVISLLTVKNGMVKLTSYNTWKSNPVLRLQKKISRCWSFFILKKTFDCNFSKFYPQNYIKIMHVFINI